MNKHSIQTLYFSKQPLGTEKNTSAEIRILNDSLSQREYREQIENAQAELVVLIDVDRVSPKDVNSLLHNYDQTHTPNSIGYIGGKRQKLWLGAVARGWNSDREILCSPIIIGHKETLCKAYGGADLTGSTLASVAYSLQKTAGVKFTPLKDTKERKIEHVKRTKWQIWSAYNLSLPAKYLFSGNFFREFFSKQGKVERDMTARMFLFCFVAFTFVLMPFLSGHYGVTGDEFVDHRHSGYVLDYFAKGDKTALSQPTTTLHLYGNSVQVITAAICRWFDVDNYYELRHFVNSAIGALGVLFVGLLGLRWAGGVCGLMSALMIFFCPRFFGHSMNNLKDIPFAVGYLISLYYTIRLFDRYPLFRPQHIIGLILGIALALGTRSGGLVLYPMLLMYAGLFYTIRYGVNNFYKFRRYGQDLRRIFTVLAIVVVASYLLGIALWPFALQNPFSGVVYSLSQFTNYTIGIRTIFDGEQMMSNMLPWNYAPIYLLIGIPIIIIIGLIGYIAYVSIRRKEFSLIGFFMLFSAIFPIVWVIYQNSNLYGGIRHLLFVLPAMVVVAGYFWSKIIHLGQRYWKIVALAVFVGLLSLPALHMVKNHPNQYVYFNEFKGGLKNAYGDYEADYYFNSLKQSADWFKVNIMPGLPKDTTTIIVTQAIHPMSYYFRHNKNIKVVYSPYYKKHSTDWDYAIFGNIYIDPYQLKNNLYPPTGTLYSPTVDGLPVSSLSKRNTKMELEGLNLANEGKNDEALEILNLYIEQYPKNEEIWGNIGKLYFLTKQYPLAINALNNALQLHPNLNEALYMKAFVYIEQKEFSAAMDAVKQMLSRNSSSVDAMYLNALIMYNQRQYQPALNILSKLLNINQNSDKGLVLAGHIFRDNGEFDKAAQMYEKAFRTTPNMMILVDWADMMVRKNDFASADKLLAKAIEVQDSFYSIYKVKLRMNIMQKEIASARENVKKIGDITDDAELYTLRAMLEQLSGDMKTAGEMVDKALSIEPYNTEAMRTKENIQKNNL